MFKVPFEYILSPVIFEEIEKLQARKVTEEYRLHAISQEQLFKDGCEAPKDENADKQHQTKRLSPSFFIENLKYTGNKWGGKYLRAPDVFFDLKKSKFPLLSLGAETYWKFGRGRRTGCDDKKDYRQNNKLVFQCFLPDLKGWLFTQKP